MSEAAQDFWLNALHQAGRFNRWVVEIIEPYLGERLLEVGCGTGNFTRLLCAGGRYVTALDIDPGYVAAARARLADNDRVSVLCADATALDWRGPAFDCVVALDVLEHLPDDAGTVRRLRRVLKPGGYLVIKVPAGRWLYSPMDRAIGHYRRYTRRTLRALVLEAGLEPLRIRHFNTLGVLGWWLNGRVLKRVTPPQEQVALFERLVPVLRVMETVFPPFMGLSLIAVARVPVESAR